MRDRQRIACALFGAALTLLLGACVPTPPRDALPVPAASAGLEEQSSQMAEGMLGDGRRGFVITEEGQLSGSLQKRFDRAVALLSQGQSAAAVSELEPVVAEAPQLSAPYINLGMAYQQLKRNEDAERVLLKGLEIAPGHPVGSQVYGLLLRRAGRFDEARQLYLSALQVYPDYLPVRRNLAVLCDLYLNDKACALEHFEYYFSLQPKDEQVGLWVNELRLRR